MLSHQQSQTKKKHSMKTYQTSLLLLNLAFALVGALAAEVAPLNPSFICQGRLESNAELEHYRAPSHRTAQGAPADAVMTNNSAKAATIALPALPAGVGELKFSEFFVQPIGPRGLELTEKLHGLDGRRVRMLGYMVHQERPPPGRFLLTPMPADIHEHDNGLADDLPASTVYVSVPTVRDQAVPYAPGLMLLTGTLSVGNRTEPDGRISVVRLALDPPEAGGK
jgi:hypothetical protein